MINHKIITARFKRFSKTKREINTNYSFFLFGINTRTCAYLMLRILFFRRYTPRRTTKAQFSYEWEKKFRSEREEGRKNIYNIVNLSSDNIIEKYIIYQNYCFNTHSHSRPSLISTWVSIIAKWLWYIYTKITTTITVIMGWWWKCN